MTNSPQDLSHLRLLAAFAHPDDEGFGSGGTLALLVARGARVTLVCATNGDVGEISDPGLATPETLAQVRQQELRSAMDVTGLQDVRFLNYRDSGMVGTPENDHPDSLHQAGFGVRSWDNLVEMSSAKFGPMWSSPTTLRGATVTREPPGPCAVTLPRQCPGRGAPAVEAGLSRTDLRSSANPGLVTSSCTMCAFPRSNFQRMWQQDGGNGHQAALCQRGR